MVEVTAWLAPTMRSAIDQPDQIAGGPERISEPSEGGPQIWKRQGQSGRLDALGIVHLCLPVEKIGWRLARHANSIIPVCAQAARRDRLYGQDVRPTTASPDGSLLFRRPEDTGSFICIPARNPAPMRPEPRIIIRHTFAGRRAAAARKSSGIGRFTLDDGERYSVPYFHSILYDHPDSPERPTDELTERRIDA